MGKIFFNVLATFAEFEGDLIRLRTRDGMVIARIKGKLPGKKPKLSDKQQKELAGCSEGSIQLALWPNYFQFRGQLFTGYFPVDKNKRLDLIKISMEQLCTTAMKS